MAHNINYDSNDQESVELLNYFVFIFSKAGTIYAELKQDSFMNTYPHQTSDIHISIFNRKKLQDY